MPTVTAQPLAATVKIVYWQRDGFWIGHLQDYPDYQTQGDSFDDLKAHLRELHDDLTGGQIPGVRKLEEMALS